MAASIALVAAALFTTATAAFTPDVRAEPDMGATHGMAMLAEPRQAMCHVVVDLTTPSAGAWAALRPAAPLASAIVFGLERAEVDPLCLALAFRDGQGWGALMTVAETIWRASMVTPWSDAWSLNARGSACASL